MEKPFIKLFRTPNSGYFYDVGKNEIIRIPENVYRHLAEVMNGTLELEQAYDDDVLQMIDSFRELGYLSSKKPVQIQHSATSVLPLLLDRCIDKITLQLTQDCNFRCKYCIYSEVKNFKQRAHAYKTMTLETAKKAILFYRDHAVDSNLYNVGFYGGEPLLQLELLKEIVLFAEKELVGKLLTFTVTTNASLLTESAAAFLDEHEVSVAVSLDGIKKNNDLNRVFQNGGGTSDIVLKNLKMIRDMYPNLFKNMHISSVIDPDIDVSSFGEYPEILKTLPLSSFLVNIEDSTEHEISLPYELCMEMETEVLLAYLADFGLYSGTVKPYGYNRVNQLKSRQAALKPANGIQNVMAPGGPCIPGKGRLFIATNGDCYPCERVNECEANCIGNIDWGFDYEKVNQILNVGTISESQCRNCWAFRLCTSCIKQFDYSQENAVAEKTRFCDSIRTSAYEKIRGLIALYEFDKYYKRFIKGDQTYEQQKENRHFSGIC